jgi:RHS repeat-associated protein
MNGRVYDPQIGRFLSADPYIQSPYNTQSYNRYSYTINNPLKYTDPTGVGHTLYRSYVSIPFHQYAHDL